MATTDALLKIEKLLAERKTDEAERQLRQFVAETPPGWNPCAESGGALSIAFWDLTEFLCYVAAHQGESDKESVSWTGPSYSKGYYYLAFLAAERQVWDEALGHIERAMQLEPDHPTIVCEKALILHRMGRNTEAVELYARAARCRPWATDGQRGRALRGSAVVLIDLGQVDVAEGLLKESLQVDPENDLAKSELEYIARLRSGDMTPQGLSFWHPKKPKGPQGGG